MSDPTQMPATRSRAALGIARKAAIITAIVVAAVYLSVLALLYFSQRSLQYFPTPISEMAPVGSIPIQSVRIATPDGEKLTAWYEPAQPGKSTILFLHGNGGRLSQGKGRYARMHTAGVGWLALSYRGYGGSTGRATEDGLLIDGIAAYDWLRSHGVAAKDIVLHGHSLGSGVATYVATKRPSRALILEAPFTAAVDVAADLYWFLPVGWLMSDQYRSHERIRDVHVPVLIAHGTLDRVIPFAQGVKLYELANPPKVFVRMAGSDHSTLVRDGVYACYWKFLGLPYDAAEAGRVCAQL